MRWPVTNSARSHQCEPMSANARDAPPSAGVDPPVGVLGREQPVLQVGAVDQVDRARLARRRCAGAPRGPSGSSGRRTGRRRRCRGAEPARAASRSARGRSTARGFSQTTCLPASSARAASSSWRWLGVQTWTTSTSGAVASSSAPAKHAAPRRAGARPPRAPLAGSRPAPPATRPPAARTAWAWTAPMNPVAGDRDPQRHVRKRTSTYGGRQAEVCELLRRRPSTVAARLWFTCPPMALRDAHPSARPRLGRRAARSSAAGRRVTRAALAQRTGLARSTVAQRVDALLESGLIYEAGDSASTGGRRPGAPGVQPRAPGVVLTADLGATHSRFAVTDLAGVLLGEQAPTTWSSPRGPEPVLDVRARALPGAARPSRGRVAARGASAIGIGIPGPVEFGSGRPVSPPIMPGWDGFASRSGSPSATRGRPSWWTTTSTSWRWASTGRPGATWSTCST